jgi:DUF971 family protein
MEPPQRPAGPPDVPQEVRRIPEERLLRITWRDGHVSEYPFAYLRGWCPCAACQGHGSEPRYVHGGDPELARIAVVGNYALGFVWGDGHDTGIYAYRYLRELCACPTCRPAAGAP